MSAKGSAYLLYDWKWKQAYDSLLKAIELNPATTDAHQLLSFYYLITGQKKEAVDIMEKALQVDPLSPMVNQYLADAYLNAGRTDDALKQVESVVRHISADACSIGVKRLVHRRKGRLEEGSRNI